ncbi:DUF624 domain-containing protein [Rugosimonospora africana]|uniref:DUF624 domain-containing protein n=1 Tax=Rugosimonospora africana TaxID=556532 RepID=A0A8J3VUB0_9ACTN|nr:DUF624 domain-containing protein [Rugosimonospora africana]GIH18433.1 hypothetical protein Raf01_66050 [Rugosimonospora africana]
MSVRTEAGRQFGEGPLARAAALIYTLLVVEVLFLVCTAPGLAVLVLLDRDASNAPLAAACALPFGPALSAALYAVDRRSLDLTDLRPAAAFWRGYKLNVGGVLRIWVPSLVVLTVLAVNLTHLGTAHVPGWWAVLLVLIAAIAALVVVNALVITSLFAFRAIDVLRLATYFLGRRPGVAVGNLGLLVVAVGVTAISSEAVVMLLASVFAAALLMTSRPMVAEVTRRFTTGAQPPLTAR